MTFTISELATSLIDDGTYEFSVTLSEVLSENVKIRWVIVPNGDLPVSSNAFSALSGEVEFTSSDNVGAVETIRLTPELGHHNFPRNFEIRIYKVVGEADTPDGESDDVLLETQQVDLSFTSPETYIERIRISGRDKNVIPLGTTDDVLAGGGIDDDTFVVTRFQYGDVMVDDSVGVNIIKFDLGVTITDYFESSSFGGRIVRSVVLTLSTGAEITIDSPNHISKTFQLGDGAVLNYAEFKTAIGATLTGPNSNLAGDYAITTPTTAPVLSENPIDDVTRITIGGRSGDIITLGTDYEVRGGGGIEDDIIVVSRFQSGDVTVDDSVGVNVIKFDYGVTITDYFEISSFGGRIVRSVVLTLSTGAEITIDSPNHVSKLFQLGDGAVLNYVEFKAAIGATLTGSNSNLAGDFAIPFPTTDPTDNQDVIPPQLSTTGAGANLDIATDGSISPHALGITFTLTDDDTDLSASSAHIAFEVRNSDGDLLTNFEVRDVDGVWTLHYVGSAIDASSFTNPVLDLVINAVTGTNQDNTLDSNTQTVRILLNDGTYFKGLSDGTGIGQFDADTDIQITGNSGNLANLERSNIIYLDENAGTDLISMGGGVDIYVIENNVNNDISISDLSVEKDIIRFDSDIVLKSHSKTVSSLGLLEITKDNIILDTDGDLSTTSDEITLNINPNNFVYQVSEFGDLMTFDELLSHFSVTTTVPEV